MKTKTLTMTALMAAVICILGPLTIPIGAVPLSFTFFAIYLTVILLGWKMGTASCLIYLLIGLVGVPVFSSFTAGPAKLFGPTGGYLIGYLFLALIGGWFVEKFRGKLLFSFLGLALGSAVCYAFGTAWLSYQADMTLEAALAAGVFPFLLGDLLKLVIALTVGPVIRKRLVRANVIACLPETHECLRS